MITRYGSYSDAQIEGFLKRIHGMIHWLLLYKERKSPVLESYFDVVQSKVHALSSFFNDSPDVIDLAVIIEQARNEYNKGKLCNNQLYRHYIFDAHSAVDHLVQKEEVVKDV